MYMYMYIAVGEDVHVHVHVLTGGCVCWLLTELEPILE